jgi:hypothetical protein
MVRAISCGVPSQVSVLGPLFWNLAYDVVLRTSLPPGTSVVCYTDDTLLLARGVHHEEAARLAELAVARVIEENMRVGPADSAAENRSDVVPQIAEGDGPTHIVRASG